MRPSTPWCRTRPSTISRPPGTSPSRCASCIESSAPGGRSVVDDGQPGQPGGHDPERASRLASRLRAGRPLSPSGRRAGRAGSATDLKGAGFEVEQMSAEFHSPRLLVVLAAICSTAARASPRSCARSGSGAASSSVDGSRPDMSPAISSRRWRESRDGFGARAGELRAAGRFLGGLRPFLRRRVAPSDAWPLWSASSRPGRRRSRSSSSGLSSDIREVRIDGSSNGPGFHRTTSSSFSSAVGSRGHP